MIIHRSQEWRLLRNKLYLPVLKSSVSIDSECRGCVDMIVCVSIDAYYHDFCTFEGDFFTFLA